MLWYRVIVYEDAQEAMWGPSDEGEETELAEHGGAQKMVAGGKAEGRRA